MRKMASGLLLFLIFLSFLPFQACGNRIFFQSNGQTAFKSETNGEGYSGKPTPYNFADPARTCTEIGANGRPLPNSQIFAYANGLVQLVRENCVDIAPRTLASQDYTMANGTIVYQNLTFAGNFSQDPFAVVAASCPAGKTLLPNATRTSLVREPLDLQAAVWEHPGLDVALVGSLASLPLYNVQRNDPNALESWHRMAQSAIFQSGESYVYSFFVKPTTAEKAMFVSFYPNVQDVQIEFDLSTGAASVQSTTGVTLEGTKAQHFAGGLYVSVYMKALSDVHANIGVASSGQYLGSSILVTALQLEKVSNFCSP